MLPNFEKRHRTRESIYMRGWDDKLSGLKLRDCPYRRKDFAEWWQRGWNDCDQNKALPRWYDAWRNRMHKQQ